MPFGAATGVVPRTFSAATSWATYHARAGVRRQHKSPLLLSWCQPRSAAFSGYSCNPRRQNSANTSTTTSSSAWQGRAKSVGSSATFATAGASSAGEEGITFVTTDAAVRRNADPGLVAFVTGANRGIGLEVTRQLLAKTEGERPSPRTRGIQCLWCTFVPMVGKTASPVRTLKIRHFNRRRPTRRFCQNSLSTKRNLAESHLLFLCSFPGQKYV